MSSKSIRLNVSTNTNVRFLTVLPSNSTIGGALPRLFSTYRTVVEENMGKDHALLQGQSLLHLTKKGCLVARDELIGQVFCDGDEIQVNIGHEQANIDELCPKVDALSKT